MRFASGAVIMHDGRPYDPAKAHAYYLRTRQLKGRKAARAESSTRNQATVGLKQAKPPTKPGLSPADRARRKQELTVRIAKLDSKLGDLEEKIREKEKAAKEAAKPDTKAEKSEKARDAKKYRDKNKQKLANEAKRTAAKNKSGGGDSKAEDSKSLQGLKETATRLRGQLAIAKEKLRAL